MGRMSEGLSLRTAPTADDTGRAAVGLCCVQRRKKQQQALPQQDPTGGTADGLTNKMTPIKLRLAMASMGRPETKVSTLCQELGITRQTLYRHISPDGPLRADGIKLLNRG